MELEAEVRALAEAGVDYETALAEAERILTAGLMKAHGGDV